MTPRDVSVIIPTLNEADCIEAAIESAWRNGAGQVIVCDGGSDDKTVSLATESIPLVVHADRGRGSQLRTGAQNAQGAILLFLHADNRLGEGCLEQLCSCVTQCTATADCWGGFKQQIDAPQPTYRLLEWGNAMRIRLRGIPFGDQAMFVTRSLYDRVGGFQPLPLMEDVVLSKRLRRHRWPLLIKCVVQIDARRWKKRGILRQTLRNWGIQMAHCLGVSEYRLAKWYRKK